MSLSDTADIAQIISDVLPLIMAAIGGGVIVFGGMMFLLKKTRRLLKNVKRPVAVLPARVGSMDHEAELLDSVGFFNIKLLSADGRSKDLVDKQFRLVVLQYNGDEAGTFWETYENLQVKQIPIIIYAKSDEIRRDTDHMQRLQKYSLQTICNTPLRLLSDVSAIMSTYPEDK